MFPRHIADLLQLWTLLEEEHGLVTENVVYPIVPNGFADHEIPITNGYKWLAIIGKINPTFSDITT